MRGSTYVPQPRGRLLFSASGPTWHLHFTSKNLQSLLRWRDRFPSEGLFWAWLLSSRTNFGSLRANSLLKVHGRNIRFWIWPNFIQPNWDSFLKNLMIVLELFGAFSSIYSLMVLLRSWKFWFCISLQNILFCNCEKSYFLHCPFIVFLEE